MKRMLTTAALIMNLAIGVLSMTSCKKDKDDVPPTDAAWQKLADDATAELTQTASFDASNPAYVFTSNKGTKVSINGTNLRKNGAAVTGLVRLELLELFDRKEMLLTNKPTMGKALPGGDVELLESGGSFSLKVKQDGVDLTTTGSVKIQTPASNSGGIKPGMTAFNGAISKTGIVWERTTAWEVIPTAVGQTPSYQLQVPGFGWFNCDRFYNDPRPKTTIRAEVPAGYGSSSQVYLLVKGLPNALGTISGNYPVGLDCYLMMLTTKDGQYRWITEETTLTSNHTIKFDLSKATTGSKADYIGHVTLLR